MDRMFIPTINIPSPRVVAVDATRRVEQRVVPCVLSSSLMSTLQTAAAACAVSCLGLHAVERHRVRAIGADTDLTREAECG